MMIHDKIISGQFLLDLKNDRSSMLHQQSPSPPPTQSKIDIYSAYAYQQQIQQMQNNLIGGLGHQHNQHHQHHLHQQHQSQYHNHHHQQPHRHQHEEVLDLSRRCDSVETPRKTPSPYNTGSSFGSSSPSTICSSPISSKVTPSAIASNLLYAQSSQQNQAPNGLPVGLSSLYPLHYPNIKQENPSPPPQQLQSEGATNNHQQSVTSIFQQQSQIFNNNHHNNTMHVDVEQPQYSHSPVSAKSVAVPFSPVTASISTVDGKQTRPFKAFPRDPVVIAANFAATDILLDNRRLQRYTEFRKHALEEIRNSNGGQRTVTNPKMRRTNSRNGNRHEGSSVGDNNSESDERIAAEESSDCDSSAGQFEKSGGQHNGANNSDGGNQIKDAAYYERRRKNNAAAKKSRDRRRIKEDEIAIRAAYLERQNIELLCQIDALKAQLAAVAKAR